MVLFRADGSSEIGLGHLVRCFSLAKMLSVDFQIGFCCISAPISFLEELKVAGFEYFPLTNNEQFLEIIQYNDIAILDNYNLGIDFHRKIKERKAKVVCIDDIHNKPFDADLIINHSPSVSKSDYQSNMDTRYLLGVDYSLLRPNFLKGAIHHRIVEDLDTVLICFGGADPNNYTLSVLNACISNENFKRINVVTGVAYLHLESFKLISDKRVFFYNSLKEKEMFDLMSNSSLAIVPASGTLYEALAAGCLVMSGYYVENQKNIYEGFKKLSAFYDLYNFDNLEIISNISLNLFDALNKKVIDGLSSERIVESFKKL